MGNVWQRLTKKFYSNKDVRILMLGMCRYQADAVADVTSL